LEHFVTVCNEITAKRKGRREGSTDQRPENDAKEGFHISAGRVVRSHSGRKFALKIREGFADR
jgi:hypothetical protein